MIACNMIEEIIWTREGKARNARSAQGGMRIILLGREGGGLYFSFGCEGWSENPVTWVNKNKYS